MAAFAVGNLLYHMAARRFPAFVTIPMSYHATLFSHIYA